MTDYEISISMYVNNTTEILSLLYDLNLLPEQLERGSQDWKRMIILVSWHMAKFSNETHRKP